MFYINGYEWDISFVDSKSHKLRRSDNTITVGVTDWNDRRVYLSRALKGEFLRKVLAHELCHCFCFSYGVIMSIEEEEFLADWISIYGAELVYLLDELTGIIFRLRENAR